ncbi:MAG: hypothetical protein PHY93_12040 [Bacteriovorax sp.]|nr:hypothetical protein [Bacteriovorax sp.]
MKSRFKYSLQITLTACLLLLGSCGKKNTVNSNPTGASGTSPFYVGNPALSSNPNIVNQVQAIRAGIACLNGPRLANDVSFFINGGSISGTTIGGNWQPGFMNSGTISNLYVGVSLYRDIMFLTKVTNGSQVIGYNVTLSFCGVPNAYVNYPALVSNDRALINFQAPNGITINTATSCGYGLIAAAMNTIIVSQRSTTNPYTSDFPVYTSFSKPNCQ